MATISRSALFELRGRARLFAARQRNDASLLRVVDDAHYTLARQLRDKLLSAPSELMRIARVIPYDENGRMVGVKLYGIRRASLLGRLGIQNGDIVRSVNGFELSSPESLLKGYAKLRSLKRLRVTLSRGGERRILKYQVR